MNHFNRLPEFDEPQLARAVEGLTIEDLDRLPYGAIRLDESGVVEIFNRTERALSGYGKRPTIGEAFFTRIAPCMDTPQFHGRIDQARRSGTLDIEFSHTGDFNDEDRLLTVRIQSSPKSGYWIFIRRED